MLKILRNHVVIDEFQDVFSSNLDGTLRVYNRNNHLIAQFKPGEWTHIEDTNRGVE